MNANNNSSSHQDSVTTIEQLKKLVQEFVNERNWKRFHTPKNLASSIAIETAELMEHFQWLTPEESLELRGRILPNSPIAEEISDVLAYILSLANALQVDLSESLRLKMLKNAQKYPPESITKE
jgi:dCTP diphosphatase